MKSEVDFSLRAEDLLLAGFLRVTRRIIQEATERIRNPTSNRTDDVHSVRITIKKLRSILRLFRPVIGDSVFNPLNDRLRSAANRLSAMRDSDVARRTLQKLSGSKKSEREAIAAALTGLRANRSAQGEFTSAMNDIAPELEQTERDLGQIQVSRKGWKAIDQGIRSVYRQGRKRMEAAISQDDDEAFHKWRIRVKNLYYELELLKPLWPKRLGPMIAAMENLQDVIGADHDLFVLKGALQEAPADFGGAEKVERVIESLERKSKKLRRIAKPLGYAVYNQSPDRFTRKLGQHFRKWRKTK